MVDTVAWFVLVHTYTRSSTAGRVDLQAPGAGWRCPTGAVHTPAYCPGTVMSGAAAKKYEFVPSGVRSTTSATKMTRTLIPQWLVKYWISNLYSIVAVLRVKNETR